MFSKLITTSCAPPAFNNFLPPCDTRMCHSPMMVKMCEQAACVQGDHILSTFGLLLRDKFLLVKESQQARDTVYAKNNATICEICAPLFEKKLRHTFMVCAGSAWIRNCGTFCRTCRDFRQTRRNLVKVPHFHGKRRRNTRIAALYKTAHCGVAIKVPTFLVGEKQRTCRHVFKCLRATFVAFF